MPHVRPPYADETDDRVRRLRAFAEAFVAGYPGTNRVITVWQITVEPHADGRDRFVVYYIRMDMSGCKADEVEVAEAAERVLAAYDPELAAISEFVGDYEK